MSSAKGQRMTPAVFGPRVDNVGAGLAAEMSESTFLESEPHVLILTGWLVEGVTLWATVATYVTPMRVMSGLQHDTRRGVDLESG